MRRLLRSLRASGAAVDHVASGTEADAALMTNNEFDLLILDLGLPLMSGLEVLRRLRARNSQMPVLILTAADSVDERVKGRACLAIDCTRKLRHAVEIRHESFIDPAFVKLLENVIAEDVEEELAHDRERIVAFRQLDEVNVPIVDRLAEIREIVFTSTFAFGFTRELEVERCLSDEVERDVRESNVLLENRTVPAPLRQPVAEHEAVVAESQQVLEKVVAQKPLRPRGIL